MMACSYFGDGKCLTLRLHFCISGNFPLDVPLAEASHRALSEHTFTHFGLRV